MSGDRQEHEYRCVGGPLDGQKIRTSADMVVLSGVPGMAYHRTRPTDTNWREEYDELWDIRGLPEPSLPDHVLEWHEDSWLSPEVAAIRAAVSTAADRE
jgi:hypothetical protein